MEAEVLAESQVVEKSQEAAAGVGAYRILLWAALLLAAFAYVGTLRFDFVYDDKGQILDNLFAQSWQHVPRYFTEHVWSYLYPNVPGNYYRPLFLLWLLVNHSLFGLHPVGWHAAAVALHVGVTLTVYLLANRIIGDRMTASVAALIFGLHPAHIEAVAWVSGATESLLAILLIPGFLCYLNGREKSPARQKWLAASVGLYALALLTKETALALPMLIIAYERINRSRESSLLRVTRSTLVILVPYIAVTAVYLVARVMVLKGLGHTVTKLSLSTILFTWPSLLWFYLKLLVWPAGLSGFYDTPYVTGAGFSSFFLPAAAVIVAAVALWLWSRRDRAIAFAAVWLALPILPLLNLSVFPEGEIAHDRYLYLPSVGLAVIAAVAIRKLPSGNFQLFRLPGLQSCVLLALACLMLAGTIVQNRIWASDLALYRRGVAVAPNNDLAKNNLANEYLERGQYEEAIGLYQQVLGRNPDFWLSNYNLGYSYYKLGRHSEAEAWLARATQLNAYDADQHVYLALARMEMGRLDEAAAGIGYAIKIRPAAPGYHYALGVVLKKQGEICPALDEFKAELAVNPKQAAAHNQIVEIESGAGRECGK